MVRAHVGPRSSSWLDRMPGSVARSACWQAELKAARHRPKSPASPKVPFPAKFPVLKDLRSSAQFSQRQPGNSSCHSWHFSVQYSRTHIVHMWESHMILLKRAWPLHGSNSPMAEPAMSKKAANVATTRMVGS